MSEIDLLTEIAQDYRKENLKLRELVRRAYEEGYLLGQALYWQSDQHLKRHWDRSVANSELEGLPR